MRCKESKLTSTSSDSSTQPPPSEPSEMDVSESKEKDQGKEQTQDQAQDQTQDKPEDQTRDQDPDWEQTEVRQALHVARFMSLTEDEEIRLDPSLVFLLQMPEPLQAEMEQKGFDVCARLRALCLERGIEGVGSSVFCRAVDDQLHSCELTPISLSLQTFVMGRSKEEVIIKYTEKKDEWGIHLPWCVQTTGPDYSESLFFIFRTWRDGIVHLRRMLEFGSYPHKGRHHMCVQGVEHCLDGAPCFGLYDWEAYLSGFRGRISEERFWALKKSVPLEIAGALVRSGVVDPGAEIRFVEKDKSRAVEGKWDDADQKNSSHFVSSVWSSKPLHIAAYNAMERVFRLDDTWLPRGNDARSNQSGKVYDYVPDRVLEDLEAQIGHLWLDPKAIAGGPNGFTTALSRNNGSSPPSYPRLIATYVTYGNTLESHSGVLPEKVHNVFSLTDQEALAILRDTLYTVPRQTMMFYSSTLEAQSNAVSKSTRGSQMIHNIIYSFCPAEDSNPVDFESSQPSLTRGM